MSVIDVVKRLNSEKIYPYVEEGKLRTKSASTSINAETVALIKQYKGDLIELFSQNTDVFVIDEPINQYKRDEPLALSFAQERLWFLEQLDQGPGSVYNIPISLRLYGLLHIDALNRALDTLVERHESLRTRFINRDGQPQQIVDSELPIKLRQVDLSKSQAQEQMIEQYRQATVLDEFDLEQGPLIRGCLLQLSCRENILLITLHHIICDGWSIGLIVKEISILYSNYCKGAANPLPPLMIQYADYAQWQREPSTSQQLIAQLDYWQKHLVGAPALLELPTDKPRPKLQSYEGALLHVDLDAQLSKKIRTFAQLHNVTVHMVLHAAFALLLSRLSGQTDIVIGTTVANRERLELEGLIGFFVNTLALRLDVSGNPDMGEFMSQVRSVSLAGYSNQGAPFEQVVERLEPERSLAYSPVIQVLLTLQNASVQELSLQGLKWSNEESPHTTARYDLSLSLSDNGDNISGSLEYATSLFEEETVGRWLEYYQLLLHGMMLGEVGNVNRLPMLSDAGRHQLLHGFNDTDQDYPDDKLLHDLFERQVERIGDCVALLCESEPPAIEAQGDYPKLYTDIKNDTAETLTFNELNNKANQVAHYLIEQGVQTDSLVGLCVPRGIHMIIGILGVLKAGGAYVPIDPDYPRNRIQYILTDAAPHYILTHSAVASALPKTAKNALMLDTQQSVLSLYPTTAVSVPQLTSRNLAYVIYTSGSTGTPKGVMVEHQAVMNLISWLNRQFGSGSDDVVLLKTPYSFDVSVGEYLWPLMFGMCLVLAKPDGHKDPAYLGELIRRFGVTKLNFVPSMLSVMLASDELQRCPSVRQVLSCGEVLQPSTVGEFYQQCPNIDLYNLYGPTESAVVISHWSCHAADALRARVPIGRSISNIQLYVLDSQNALVPPGVCGELHIGGVGLARGYLNLPALTDEKFIVVDTLNLSERECRLYKTGDLARWLPDGNIDFLGRVDHQVKIRGFRVELGEIEFQLSRHPAVKECVVVSRTENAYTLLVAYVVMHDDLVSREEIQAYLSRCVPAYMVPGSFVTLQRIPLNANGKVDRNSLLRPEIAQNASFVAPVTDTEKTLCQIWESLLGVDQVSTSDDFFAIGGHSLLAAQLVFQVNKSFAVQLVIKEIFSSSTIASLAKTVDDLRSMRQAGEGRSEHNLSEIGHYDRKDGTPIPLSFTQLLLWFLSVTTGNTSNISEFLLLDGDVELQRLNQALNILIEDHEIIRAKISKIQPIQTIKTCQNFEITYHERVQGKEKNKYINELLSSINDPFDLSSPPLVRASLLRIAQDQHVLVLVFPHIVIDGAGFRIFTEHLEKTYRALLNNSCSTHSDQKIRFSDFVHWEREQTEKLALKNKKFWINALEKSGYPEFPDKYLSESGSVINAEVAISPDTLRRLDSIGKREKATLQMVLMTVVGYSVSRTIQQSTFCLTSILENRDIDGLNGLIAPLFSTMLTPINIVQNSSFMETLASVKTHTLNAYDYKLCSPSLPMSLAALPRWKRSPKLYLYCIDKLSRLCSAVFKRWRISPTLLKEYFMLEELPPELNWSQLLRKQPPKICRNPAIVVNVLPGFFDNVHGAVGNEEISWNRMSDSQLNRLFKQDYVDNIILGGAEKHEAMEKSWSDGQVYFNILRTQEGRYLINIQCRCLNEAGLEALAETTRMELIRICDPPLYQRTVS